MVGQVHHRRLQAGEAHVQLRSRDPGVGQGIDPALGLLRQLVHGLAAGIGQAQDPGGLIEALPRRVIPGGTQDPDIGVVPDIGDEGVAAGDGQGQEGGLQVREGQVVGGDVSPDVVHRDQRHAPGIGQGLGEAQAHQHGPDEARGIGDGDGVDVVLGAVGLRQGPLRQGRDDLHMLAGGDLRHHAAVEGVHLRLRGDGVGQDLPSVLHHGGGGLVAGGFKGQNLHSYLSSSSFQFSLGGTPSARVQGICTARP